MSAHNLLNSRAILTAAVSAALLAAAPAVAEDSGRSFEIYGFAQADAIYDFGRLNPDWDDAFRPSKIANPEGEYGSNGQASLSVKQSKLRHQGHDADQRRARTAQLQVRVRPVRHRRGCRPDDVPSAARLWRVGLAAGRPDQQHLHGHRRVPQRDRLLGTERHGVLAQRADPLDTVADREQLVRDRHRGPVQRHRYGADSRSSTRNSATTSRPTRNCRTSRRTSARRATGATCRSPASCASSATTPRAR